MDGGIAEGALLSTLAAEASSAALPAALGAGEMAAIGASTGMFGGAGGMLGALGEGTAMGMIPEAAAIPGASSLTPSLLNANPTAYGQVANALQASGTPNFASLAEGANYGGSGFSQFPGTGTEGIGSLTRSLGTGANLAEGAANASMFPSESDLAYSELAQKQALQNMGGNQGFGGLDTIMKAYSAIPKELRYAGIGYGALQALNDDKNKYGTPPKEKYSGPLSKFQYDPSRYTPTTTPQPTPYTPTRYAYAEGGISSLGGYSDGGRMLKGPGDGMSDSIPATISNKQPARLADGEFVVPADVVSHLGNGSTDAGAKQLYKMMDKVRVARTGKKMQGRQISPRKYVPA
jgi:hypothetical protein